MHAHPPYREKEVASGQEGGGGGAFRAFIRTNDVKPL